MTLPREDNDGVDAAAAVISQAQRLGLTWRIIPATVQGSDANVNNVAVTVDGDPDTQVRAQSLIGTLPNATRVMLIIVPPANQYIIGYYGSPPLAGGLRDRVDSISNSAAIGAETVVLTGNRMTFVNGRAYRVIWSQRVDHSAAQIASVRVRKTALAGTQLSFWQAQVTAAVGNTYYYETVIKRVAGTNLSDNLVLTLAASAGTATARGATDTVRFMEVWDCGLASQFPNALAIV